MNPWALLPGFVAAPILLCLCVLLYLRRPSEPLWPVVLFCHICALLWAVGEIGTWFAANLEQETLALTVLYTGSIPLPALWWSAAVRTARASGLRVGWLHWPGVQVLPAGIAAVSWLAFMTNPWHGRFITPIVQGPNLHHTAFWLALFAGYAEIAGASLLFAVVARRHRTPHQRRSAALLAGATAAPLAANAAYLLLPGALPVDFVGLGLCVSSAMILYGIRSTQLFSLQPVALAEVVRHDPNGVLLLGPDGRLRFWNPAAKSLLAGLPLRVDLDVVAALLPRLRREDGSAPKDRDALFREILAAPRGADALPFAFACGEAEPRWLRLSAAAVPSRRGRVAALALRVEDVSPLRRAQEERWALEAQVRHAEKLGSLGLLAGGIAHDFNNLLAVILGNASLALRMPVADDAVRTHLEEIELATRQAADLTHQMLAYAGRAPRTDERVDLSRLVQEMARLLDVVMGRARLGIALDPGLPAVDGDPGQLGQVVMNLVANAAEAVGERPGLVTVSARRCAGPPGPGAGEVEGVLLEVCDDGCGMDEATRARSFDPFFSTKNGGRGLGLAVVQGVVGSHGGTIRIESAPGAGTRVGVWLPAARAGAPARVPRRERAPVRDGRWVGSGTVLVVDDQDSVRRMVRSVLASLGFDVVVASGGAEALARFRELRGQLRLVVLDCKMPDLDGEQVLAAIRELDPEVPVIVSSGYSESDVRALLDAEKTAGFLPKPFELRDLVAMVRRVLEPRAGS